MPRRRRRRWPRLLRPRRNDLTEAAIGLVPEIGAVLDRLAALARRAARADERQRRDLLRAVRRPRGAAPRAAAFVTRGGTRLVVGRGLLREAPPVEGISC